MTWKLLLLALLLWALAAWLERRREQALLRRLEATKDPLAASLAVEAAKYEAGEARGLFACINRCLRRLR